MKGEVRPAAVVLKAIFSMELELMKCSFAVNKLHCARLG